MKKGQPNVAKSVTWQVRAHLTAGRTGGDVRFGSEAVIGVLTVGFAVRGKRLLCAKSGHLDLAHTHPRREPIGTDLDDILVEARNKIAKQQTKPAAGKR